MSCILDVVVDELQGASWKKKKYEIEGDNREGNLLMPDGQMNDEHRENKTRRFDSRSTQGHWASRSYIIETIDAAVNDLDQL